MKPLNFEQLVVAYAHDGLNAPDQFLRELAKHEAAMIIDGMLVISQLGIMLAIKHAPDKTKGRELLGLLKSRYRSEEQYQSDLKTAGLSEL